MRPVFRLFTVFFCLLAPAHSEEITIVIETLPGRMEFSRNVIEVDPEAQVRLTLNNTDRMQHNHVLCRSGKDNAMEVAKAAWVLGADAVPREYVPDSDLVLEATKIVNPGESGELTVTMPKEEGTILGIVEERKTGASYLPT